MTTDGGVVQYARFLFTRNRRRDFTAFVRPSEMSNKDVSTLANAFNYVNDISPLTPDAPGLYCFPLGAYLYVLRHYDSGRTHAGRAIPVIEGIAIQREDENALGVYLAEIVAAGELLAVAEEAGDVETLERTTSEVYEWTPEPVDADEQDAEPDESNESASDDTVDRLAERYATDWLLLPFDDGGRATLVAALSDDRLPILHFAFGGNAEVVAQFKQSGIMFDVVGYATASAPEFRPRDHVKAVDVREILPDAAADEPTHFPPPDTVIPETAEPVEAAGGTSAFGEPVLPIYEERQRQQRRRRKRSLLRRLVDVLLGR